jgi:HAD superfamily hydrolase (TIGR01509 family)
MIKTIFWDNDGVLVDTEWFYYEATRRVMERLGVALSEAEYVEGFMVRSTGAWHLLVEKGFSEEGIPVLKEERNILYSQLLDGADVLIPGVRDVVRSLSGRFVMGIVTSSRREHFNIIHRSTGILPFFDFVIAAEDYTRYKPDPEPYLLALERSGYPPDECLVVEDSERGLLSASGAGLNCVAIPHGLSKRGRFERAFKILGDVTELPPLLKTLNANA